MSRKARRLTPEERELWQHVAGSVQALHPAPLPELDLPVAMRPKPAKPKIAKPEITGFRIGQTAPRAVLRHDLAPTPAERLRQTRVVMDKRTHREMTRGKTKPEARLDLHGRTLAAAHPELIRFVLKAQAEGKRLVLIITGKGKLGTDDGPIPQRQGALRHQVPHWLSAPPLTGAVMQVAEAHLKHGGSGACYVYLRRLPGLAARP